MANVMIKYLKFAQILNRRLSFSSLKHYPRQYLFRSYTNSKFGKSYATAAYKLALNTDTGIRSNDAGISSDVKDIQSIDAALAKIDSAIRRNGRTQMKNIDKVFSSITSNEVTSSLHGLYLLRSCKYCIDELPSERIKMVNEIWNRYQELGIEFDVRHFNAMLDVHVKNHLDFNPVDILASMEDLKIEPNKDTYMLIMKKYCQEGNISGASEMLEYMKEKQMPADEKVFNYLIEAHINNNDIAGAKEMVEVMKSSNLEPTADTHAVFACGYAASGDKEKMISYLEKCRSAHDIQNYLKVIDVLASSGNHEYIDDVLSMIERKEFHQQEFINAAVELIHKKCIDVAYKLATASCTPDYTEGANIFIKQLIKTGEVELSEVMNYCEQIRKDGLNQNIYLVASKAFVDSRKIDDIIPLLKRSQELGYYVRSSTFSLFFSSVKENKHSEDCWLLLKNMSDLGVLCDFKTYLENIYPALGVPKPDEVSEGIKRSGQAINVAVDALFVYYCNIGKLDYALKLIEKFPIKISNRFEVETFLRLYEEINTEDCAKYFKILKFIFMEDSDFSTKCDVQGKLLAEMILSRPRLLELLLDRFEDVIFSDYTLKICEMELSARNPSRLSYLKKIKALNAERNSLMKHKNLSEADEDKYISRLQAQNISCRSFLLNRISHHTKNKNIIRVQQLLMIFDELKFEYTPLILCNLFGLWCAAADIDKAKETLNKIKTSFPGFQIDLPRALDYVSLLMKYEKFDESYETLKNFLESRAIYSSREALFRSVSRFSQTLSSTHDQEIVKKMQNLILPLSKELGSMKSLLDPSVKIHLLKNDLKSALDAFRNIVVTHRVPACLNQFLKKCIHSNEKDILQQVVDLTISCSGKSYALLELAVAFIELFDIQNAAKVVKSLGAETDPKVLDNICDRLSQLDKLNELESLIQITESLNHAHRESLYIHAFKACARRNEFDRALQLFEKLKTEVIEPDIEIIKLLTDLLKKNNQPLPLSLISKSPGEISPIVTEATKSFLEHLDAGNSEAALKELSGLKKGYIRTLSIKTLTDLVDLCLQKNSVHELARNVHAMSYIIENVKDVLGPIIEKYSQAGDVEKFRLITSFIPDFSLMSIRFNSYFCKAFITGGKYESLLSSLEERTAQKNKLFSTIAFEELLKLPEYEERIFNLAVKYLDSNYNLPMSFLWAHYFCKEKYEKADEILKKFPLSIERVDNVVLKNIKTNENVDVAKKFVYFIKDTQVRSRVKEKAYGAAIDLLVFKGMYDEAANMVVDSERQNLELHKYYLSTLVTLKSILEKENKPVPFTIPLGTASESSSDSD